MAQTNAKVLTAHVPLPLAEKVDQMAARLERSRGWIMKQAMSAWIDQEEERSRLTREALVPGASSITRPCRRGLKASALTLHCRCRADGIEVDGESVIGSGAVV